jgi:hypothetical protein
VPAILPLSDRAEIAVVRWLQQQPGRPTWQADQAACEACPGLLTPEKKLVQAVLNSYGIQEREEDLPGAALAGGEGVWRLRPEDTPRLRRVELNDLRMLLLELGKRLGFRTWRKGDAIHWPGEPAYTFYVRASGVLGNLIFDPPSTQGQRVLVYPGGRAGLIDFKLRRDSRLAQAASAWLFVKFRHLRRLAEDPSLTRESFPSQIDLDPLSNADTQIRLF